MSAARKPPTDHLEVIRQRPGWIGEEGQQPVQPPTPERCQGRRCDRRATFYSLGSRLSYCARHARAASDLFGHRVVPLVPCACCGRRGPLGLRLAFDGEAKARVLCRDCAELVRDLVEGRAS